MSTQFPEKQTRSKTGGLLSESERDSGFLRVDDPPDTKKRTAPVRGAIVQPVLLEYRNNPQNEFKLDESIDTEPEYETDAETSFLTAERSQLGQDLDQTLNESSAVNDSVILDQTSEQVQLSDITSDGSVLYKLYNPVDSDILNLSDRLRNTTFSDYFKDQTWYKNSILGSPMLRSPTKSAMATNKPERSEVESEKSKFDTLELTEEQNAELERLERRKRKENDDSSSFADTFLELAKTDPDAAKNAYEKRYKDLEEQQRLLASKMKKEWLMTQLVEEELGLDMGLAPLKPQPQPPDIGTVPRSRRSSMVSSDQSVAGPGGIPTILSKLSKPIRTVLDREKRDDDYYLRKANKQLNSLTSNEIWSELGRDRVLTDQSAKIDRLGELLLTVTEEMAKLNNENRTKTRSLVEKTSPLTPNPDYSYPSDPADEEVYRKAATAFQTSTKIIDRSLDFSKQPYDYLLYLCSHSNAVASNYGLSKEQQYELILSFVPSVSDLAKDLTLHVTLESLFQYANMMATTIYTRYELETQLEQWHLDWSNVSTLNQSLTKLKRILIELGGEDSRTDPRLLFRELIKKIRRERNLPYSVVRSLDEARIKVDRESDPLELQAILLACLKPLLSMKRPDRSSNVHAISEATELLNVDTDLPDVKYKSADSKQQHQPTQPTSKNQGSGQQSDNKRPPPGTFVNPYPIKGVVMIGKGNKLSEEFEKHFKGFCYRCGRSGHGASYCRTYTHGKPVLSLCKVCRRGLHDVCKFRNDTINVNQKSGNINNTNSGGNKGKTSQTSQNQQQNKTNAPTKRRSNPNQKVVNAVSTLEAKLESIAQLVANPRIIESVEYNSPSQGLVASSPVPVPAPQNAGALVPASKAVVPMKSVISLNYGPN